MFMIGMAIALQLPGCPRASTAAGRCVPFMSPGPGCRPALLLHFTAHSAPPQCSWHRRSYRCCWHQIDEALIDSRRRRPRSCTAGSNGTAGPKRRRWRQRERWAAVRVGPLHSHRDHSSERAGGVQSTHWQHTQLWSRRRGATIRGTQSHGLILACTKVRTPRATTPFSNLLLDSRIAWQSRDANRCRRIRYTGGFQFGYSEGFRQGRNRSTCLR